MKIHDLYRKFEGGHWHYNMKTNLSYRNGFYDIRINVTDTEGGEISRIFYSAVRLVGQSVVLNFSAGDREVYRNRSLSFYINGTDLEDEEWELTPHLEIFINEEWNDTVLGKVVFSEPRYVITGSEKNETTDYWLVYFTPPVEMNLSSYKFRVRFNDTFSSPTYSKWKYLGYSITIRNNPPEIINIPDTFSGYEDHNLTVNLTPYQWDMEDDDTNLTWSLVSYNTSFIKGFVSWTENNTFMFEPKLDMNNGTIVRFKLTDKDGNSTEVNVTLFFNPVGDAPRLNLSQLEIISNLSWNGNYIYNKYANISANVSGYDPEGTEVMFLYKWYYNMSGGAGYQERDIILNSKGEAVNSPYLILGETYYLNISGTIEPFNFTRNATVFLNVTPYTTEEPIYGNWSVVNITIQNTPPMVINLNLSWSWNGQPQPEVNITSTLYLDDYLVSDPDMDEIDETMYQWYYSEDAVNWTAIPDANTTTLYLYSYAKSNPSAIEKILEKGMYLRVGVNASDQFYNYFGNATFSPSILIHNTPPVMKGGVAINSSFVKPWIAYTNTSLTAVELNYFDIDGDALDHYTYRWYLNGVWLQDHYNKTLPSTLFKKGDEIQVVLQAYDGENYSVPVNATILISNAPPTLGGVLIKNLTYPVANLSNTLRATVSEYSDIDGDPLDHLIYKWYRNGIGIADENGNGRDLILTSYLEGGIFHKGDEIWVEVAAVDGDGAKGKFVRSPTVIIQNSLPVVKDINFSVENPEFEDHIPRVNSHITVNVTTYDIDGDSLHYTYIWYVSEDGSVYDSYIYSNSSKPSNTFHKENVTTFFKGARLSIQVLVSDSTHKPYIYNISDFSWNYLKNLTIENTPPKVNRADVTFRKIVDDQETNILNENSYIFIQIDHTSNDVLDVDGDDFTLFCRWFINGVAYPSTQESIQFVRKGSISSTQLKPDMFKKGDSITVVIWASDGEDSGELVSSYINTSGPY
ncbi:MAG TPA: hypothetical protein EYP29_01760, partial [Thermoplasmata archaeon]|nr:hypothetical protein [Thermoplasmata archaeon]